MRNQRKFSQEFKHQVAEELLRGIKPTGIATSVKFSTAVIVDSVEQ